MPLLANTGEIGKDPTDTRNRLTPCDVTKPLEVSGAVYAVHPCSFVAFKGNTQDSYSVLASFGADFGGRASTDVSISGGLAQYFATGMAAQILAAKGGAALVATGSAARESAETPADDAIAALVSGSPRFGVGAERARASAALEGQISAKIRSTAAENLAARLSAFEQTLGISSGAVAACQSRAPAACAEFVDDRDLYADLNLPSRQAAVEAALAAWTTP